MEQADEAKLASYRLMVAEISAEIRSRRDPELMFTAAVVGALGAVAWGVAATASLNAIKGLPLYQHPAIVGALAVVLMAAPVLFRIMRENRLYRALRAEQLRINCEFARLSGMAEDELPAGLRSSGDLKGSGVWYSTAIVSSSTIGAFLFCLSVYAVTRA